MDWDVATSAPGSATSYFGLGSPHNYYGFNGRLRSSLCASRVYSVTDSVSLLFSTPPSPVSTVICPVFAQGVRDSRDVLLPLGDNVEPEVEVTATFPEDNAFGREYPSINGRRVLTGWSVDVVNGEKNNMFLMVENKSERNITLKTVSGSVHHVDTNALVKNVRGSTCCSSVVGLTLLQITALPYKMPLLQNIKLQVPYQFHSE